MDIEQVSKITDKIINGINEIHSISKEDLGFEPKDTLLVAAEGNAFLGYVHARGLTCHLLALYVAQDNRRSTAKVGSSLLLSAIESLSTQGARQIFLGVEPNNKQAIPFFQKHGFKIFGEGKTGFTTLTHSISCNT